MKTTIQLKTERESIQFNEFEQILRLLLNLDLLSHDEEIEYMNEWYELFKTTKCDTVLEWAIEHFSSVTKNTHDFWIDARGYKILQIEKAIKRR